MKLYYFYAPSEYRGIHKAHGVISFKLKALYADKAYSQRKGKEITQFHFVDDLDCFVHTKVPGHYSFEFDHGKDTCMGHHATSYKELCEAEANWGFRPVKEADYFRLRKLATTLLFRHTNFNRIWLGRNDYYYSNRTFGGSFYDFTLASFHYHPNRKKAPYQNRVWALNHLPLPLYDVISTEEIKIFMYKDKPSKEPYDAYKFKIQAINPMLNAVGTKFTSFEDGVKRVLGDNAMKVNLHQYERLRKIAKHLIWEHSEVDLQPLRKRQDYTVTILDL